MEAKELTTDRKALLINLDKALYGTFAEIGAGQEVARHFFRVGGAAGTVAKTMSAYDMKFSDEIYGKSDRYVSKKRLLAMLDHEYELLIQRLAASRGNETRFFVFADTVSARNFKGTNECHGWMGVRMQLEPNGPPHDIMLHVRMKDRENLLQQQALGVFGVNLMYGAFYMHNDQEAFVKSLLDELSADRIEVDMLEWSGPKFRHLDSRLLSLKLVQNSLTNAVMFGPKREILQPSEVLYKRPVLVERGSFRPITNLNVDMLESAKRRFASEPCNAGKEPLVLVEITLNNLLSTGALAHVDFVARAETLSALGYNVLISNYPEYYRLALYLRQYSKETLGLVLGINSLLQMFNEKYYQHLEGGILESMGKLFQLNTKLYIYPMTAHMYRTYIAGVPGYEDLPAAQQDAIITADNVPMPDKLKFLYQHLKSLGCISALTDFNPNVLEISSRDVLKKILAGETGWEKDVPEAAARIIKSVEILHATAAIS
ncbi:MAG: TonB-dependent receptor [Oligoflexia bacterium]|nr:TonB-dependent receptor [Oligoflexia bacterium]